MDEQFLITFTSTDSGSAVRDYYQKTLSSNGWIFDGVNDTTGVIGFVFLNYSTTGFVYIHLVVQQLASQKPVYIHNSIMNYVYKINTGLCPRDTLCYNTNHLRQEWNITASPIIITKMIISLRLLGEACKDKDISKPTHRPTQSRRAIYFIWCICRGEDHRRCDKATSLHHRTELWLNHEIAYPAPFTLRVLRGDLLRVW